MYLYSIFGYEHNITLTHQSKFSEDEFTVMCKEAAIEGSDDFGYYSESFIVKHLESAYGFKRAEYTAGFNSDADLDE